jgi:hypothetical protein
MHEPWTNLREMYERAMKNLEKREAGLARSHLKFAEHTAETIGTKAHGDERHRAGRIYAAVRRAQHLIDMQQALETLRQAHDAFLVPPAPPPTNL